MPLHLLGKKSWNVYNQDNISRVRKDEAEAKAVDEAAEQRMQEEDAARRLAILRGEAVPALPETEPDDQHECQSKNQPGETHEHRRKARRDEDYTTRDRKRKRRHGEDDTDRDIRYARQDRELGQKASQTLSVQQIKKGGNAEAPLQDHAGHIQLFAPPDEKSIRARQKNEEAEAEKEKKRKREEDLVTMKFSNAAGYHNGMQKPWYAAGPSTDLPASTASRNEVMIAELKGKDVWGNEDPRRKERETKRIVSSDPFAAMQHAQRQLKQSEQDKVEWQRKQKTEIEALKKETQEKRRRREQDDIDSIDGFSLDASPMERGDRGRRTHRHHAHRRHRSRSRERDRQQSKGREKHSSHQH